jgi:hypothetical protein
MGRPLILAAIALSLTAPLHAQSTPPQPDASGSPTAIMDVPEKVICKQEKATGSRVASRKTCLTDRQWRERAAKVQEDLDRMVRTGNGGN